MDILIRVIRFLLNFFYYNKFKEDDQNWSNEGLEVIDKDELPEDAVTQLHKDIKERKATRKEIAVHSPTEQIVPYITSDWGNRIGYRKGKKTKVFHYGIDLYAPAGQEGKPIRNKGFAIEAGTVIALEVHNPGAPSCFKRAAHNSKEWVYLKTNSPTSYICYIGEKTGFKYWQKHTLNHVKVGDKLYRGQHVVDYGNYGWCRLSHCHLEIHVFSKLMDKWVPKNPRKLLRKYGLNFTGRVKLKYDYEELIL
jgi:murein DD-endopeptidase MepM/ murein hydrolase activator NlpD